MTRVNAGITTSLDGYITGPNDGPELNLEHVRLLQSPFATHITYRVLR